MILYNTLSRKKEEFIPVEKGVVKMYSCGPTVYNFAHIGNLRTYVFMDLLRKCFEQEGYRIDGVMNITDVGHLLSDGDEGEDKMVLAAEKQKKSPYEIAEYYTKIFFEDLQKLNVQRPEHTPKATDHIVEMIAFVQELVVKGYAYETSDGIYFDISKFADYGKLSRLNLEEQLAGARVEVNGEKRHPADFALWKKAPKEHIMKWESPWGLGYPGWHIECSAMSEKYLGRVFDVHTGGVDHIPVHHENEIAQSEAKAGAQTVHYWMHGEFMLVNGGKMSKKLGNTYTLSQLSEMGYSPMVFRYFCLNAHYRKKLNFTFEGMNAAKVSYERLLGQLAQHKNAKKAAVDLSGYTKQFYAAASDDINIPLGLGILWEMVKDVPKNAAVYEKALEFDRILSLDLSSAVGRPSQQSIPDDITALAEERKIAKQNKNYARSDELRAILLQKGYVVADTKDGYTLKKTEGK